VKDSKYVSLGFAGWEVNGVVASSGGASVMTLLPLLFTDPLQAVSMDCEERENERAQEDNYQAFRKTCAYG
jgi:hypothetical protein